MLQPRVLPKIIEQANTNGVKTTLLLQTNGSLLASSGSTKEMDKLIAAIISNVWNSYSKAGRNAFNGASRYNNNNMDDNQNNNFEYDDDDEDDMGEDDDEDRHHHHNNEDIHQSSTNTPQIVEKLNCLLLDCEAGRVAITGVSPKVILCLCADNDVDFGLLKAKALTIREYLAKPFALVETGE